MSRPRRIAVISTASACGKTTLGKHLARRLGVRFVELDALVHGPGWSETPDDELRAKLRPLLDEEGWVVDGNYRNKLGDLVLAQADLVLWLDLPIHVWLPRLVRRTLARAAKREVLWNGNRESLKTSFWGRDSLIGFALRNQGARRRDWPVLLAPYRCARLVSQDDIDRFVAALLADADADAARASAADTAKTADTADTANAADAADTANAAATSPPAPPRS